MSTYRITYKRAQNELPDLVEAYGYRVSGRFFEFYIIQDGSRVKTIASISSDLVAYVAMDAGSE